jgi:hypothetical protein
MEMNVGGGVCHHGATAGWRRSQHLDRCRRGVVGNRDDQMVPGMDVEGGIFEAVRRHETEKSPALIVGFGLIRESDAQIAIVAEQSGRITHDGACGKPKARIRNRRDRGERAGRPEGAEGEEPESEETREGQRASKRSGITTGLAISGNCATSLSARSFSRGVALWNSIFLGMNPTQPHLSEWMSTGPNRKF